MSYDLVVLLYLTRHSGQLNLMNCIRLFFQIKFLKSKEGTAMVLMGDGLAVDRCVQNLNNVSVGLTGAAPVCHNNHANDERNNVTEHKLQLAFSKQFQLSEVTNPYPLPDKSPSYKEYINNKNNRFLNPGMARKNRIQPPSKVSSNRFRFHFCRDNL